MAFVLNQFISHKQNCSIYDGICTQPTYFSQAKLQYVFTYLWGQSNAWQRMYWQWDPPFLQIL